MFSFDIVPPCSSSGLLRHLPFSLTLFGEGGGASSSSGEGGVGGSDTGVTSEAAAQTPGAKSRSGKNPLASVKYGKQAPEDPTEAAAGSHQSPPEDSGDAREDTRRGEFDRLIQGEYKDLFNEKVSGIVRSRLQGREDTERRLSEAERRLSESQQMTGILAKKYGVDPDDVSAISRAVLSDDTLLEKEAEDRGLTVAQYRQMVKIERENSELRRSLQQKSAQESASRLYADWMSQASEAKKVYPDLDIRKELENPLFSQLLRAHVDVKTAFEVIHKDKLIPAAMQFAAQTAERKIAAKMAASSARPDEGGMKSSSSALVKNDVSKFTKEDREEILRRVSMGEKIYL